jgi:hypothetical protein
MAFRLSLITLPATWAKFGSFQKTYNLDLEHSQGGCDVHAVTQFTRETGAALLRNGTLIRKSQEERTRRDSYRQHSRVRRRSLLARLPHFT